MVKSELIGQEVVGGCWDGQCIQKKYGPWSLKPRKLKANRKRNRQIAFGILQRPQRGESRFL